MKRSVAQTFRPASRPVNQLELDIDPLFLEETELDRGGGHEIRGESTSATIKRNIRHTPQKYELERSSSPCRRLQLDVATIFP